MADLRAYVANCLMAGHTITHHFDTSWSRNIVEFKCAEKTFIFTQHDYIVKNQQNKFIGTFAETSEVLVKDVSANEVNTTLEELDRICWLLSFAGISRVVRYGHDYPDGSNCGARNAAIGTAEYFRTSIEIKDGETIKFFIEQTYPSYVTLEKTRNLNVVFDYLTQAERCNQPTELRLIIAFTILENLKATFARCKSIDYVGGRFIKPLKPGKKVETYSFKELLHMMFQDIGMENNLEEIIKLRNDIIHSGVSDKSADAQFVMYAKIHDIIREYVLRLLHYHGNYLIYSSGSNTTASL
ncbi:DUF3644 domain-containing protein [Methylotenera mobilis]|jgi:hypothetical protein|uniref:DUF3644 domain-containing protein n=1 Tax=Methylotenera mobilis TaxID=359408 RepID=UPI00036417D9|nr:DUF3644 domain-containing protein [Methylotenera mobilis]PPC95954.1 MAG: hypothetical protein CTY32_07645 [Methylotenera sp.]